MSNSPTHTKHDMANQHPKTLCRAHSASALGVRCLPRGRISAGISHMYPPHPCPGCLPWEYGLQLMIELSVADLRMG